MIRARLVLLRHGQSVWNAQNRFTGWVDVPLTEKGIKEARTAGALLQRDGLLIDVAHTSLLRRAIVTTNLALEESDRLWVPQLRTWRLNERHYGALAGLDKTETTALHGEEQVRVWRRSYTVRPPALASAGEFAYDERYANIPLQDLPLTESLADVQARLLPYWEESVLPQLASGLTVLIGAHGNSLRALVKHIEHLSDEEVVELEIATGTPLVYEATVSPTGSFSFGPATVLSPLSV